MKLFRIFPALLVVAAIFMTACGDNQAEVARQQQKMQEVSAQQRQLVNNTLNKVNSLAERVRSTSANMEEQSQIASELQIDIRMTQRTLEQLAGELDALRTEISEQNRQLEGASANAAESAPAAASDDNGFFRILLLIIGIVIILGLIYMVLRSRSDYDEDDDDFADFEDDDFGDFEDDFEDDFEEEDFLDEDEKKKKGEEKKEGDEGDEEKK